MNKILWMKQTKCLLPDARYVTKQKNSFYIFLKAKFQLFENFMVSSRTPESVISLKFFSACERQLAREF